MTHLKLTDICKQFAETTAVCDFNLEVQKGEFVSFLGPSGCGKTTTLRMIAGFETPTTGSVLIDDIDITDKAPNQRDVGMVFQAYGLFPNMNVAQNIGYGLRVRRKSKAEIKQRVEEMLSLIHLEQKGNSFPHQLSGGQQQRVALARALAIQPQVLLLDEPLSALDAKIRVQLRAEIRAIQRKLNITAIYVTHDQEEALSISDRIVVMYEGKIEQIGTPFEIYNFPQTAFVASFVGTLNTTSAEVVDPTKKLLQIDGVQLRTAESLENMHKGDKITIAIRPERFNFAAVEKKANLLDCKIENITFLGSVVRIQVLVGSNRFYMDTFNNPFLELPKIGDKDQVTCSTEAVLVLKS
ncbi:MAG: ABC transporter ATP-binding protein [Anaerolineales bacterium]|jgi:putative spermidine/putrescine transport system ATP-binding protein